MDETIIKIKPTNCNSVKIISQSDKALIDVPKSNKPKSIKNCEIVNIKKAFLNFN